MASYGEGKEASCFWCFGNTAACFCLCDNWRWLWAQPANNARKWRVDLLLLIVTSFLRIPVGLILGRSRFREIKLKLLNSACTLPTH